MPDPTLWPVDPLILPAFLLAMVLIELTPGPNMGYLALVSAARGRMAGLLTVVGVTLGLGLYLAVSIYGLTRTPLGAPAVLSVLKWAGVGYMLWLALEAVLPQGPAGPAGPIPPFAASRLVLRGIVANILNPKAALFYVVILPGFIHSGFAPARTQMVILGGAHILISLAVHLSIVLGTDGAAVRLSIPARRWLRWVLAFGLAATAVWVALVPQ
jgi:threonine/homoserine/homoserine lactone efflux protein